MSFSPVIVTIIIIIIMIIIIWLYILQTFFRPSYNYIINTLTLPPLTTTTRRRRRTLITRIVVYRRDSGANPERKKIYRDRRPYKRGRRNWKIAKMPTYIHYSHIHAESAHNLYACVRASTHILLYTHTHTHTICPRSFIRRLYAVVVVVVVVGGR